MGIYVCDSNKPENLDIEGIGETYAAKLKEAGIATTDQLLEAGATKKGRDELAKKTGITPKDVILDLNGQF